MKSHGHFLPIIVLVCSSTFWGISWIPLQFFRERGLHGLVVIFVAHVILALLIAPVILRKLNQGNHLYLFGVAIAGGLGITCFTFAYAYGDVVRVMVLFYLLPVWGVLGGKIFLNERVDIVRWLGVVIAIPGAFLILGGSKILSSPPTWMDLLALLSGMSFAANNVLFRGVGHVRLSVKMFAMFAGCSLISGLFILAGAQSIEITSVSTSAWGLLVGYAAVLLLAANYGSQWSIERLEAGRSSIIIITQLIAAVVSATWIGGERLSLSEWLGGLLVLSAAVIESLRNPEISRETLTR